jgi:hypothetical protein
VAACLGGSLGVSAGTLGADTEAVLLIAAWTG